MLLSPTILVLALVIVCRVLSAVHETLFRAESGLDADGFVSDVESFVGLANYADLFVGESGRRFLNAFANTTFFTVTTVFLETVLGLCLALAMNRAFRGRSFLRASILVPSAVPTTVSRPAVALDLPVRGHRQQPARLRNPLDRRRQRLRTRRHHRRSLEDSAVHRPPGPRGHAGHPRRSLRSRPDRRRRLVAPAWLHHPPAGQAHLLLVAVLFRMLDALRMFDLPFVLIGPGKESVETLSMLAWDESNQLRYGSASAFAVMLFLYVAVVAIVFVKVLGADVTGAKELKLMSKKTARKNRLAATQTTATAEQTDQKKAEATR